MQLTLARLLIFTCFAFTTQFASAQDVPPGKEGELAKIVPPKEGEVACYARKYDKKHLASHPDQEVTEMEFRLTYYKHDPDEFNDLGQRNYYFQLIAKTRDHPRRLSASGECGPKGNGIFCGVECDGGGVMVKRRDGKLLVDLETMGRIRMTESCDDEGGIEVESGKDDKTFLLSPLADAQCPGYDSW